MKTVILAAGMGTRLRPISNNIPKAFVEIDNVPLIIRSLENIKSFDIEDVIIVIGYGGDYFKKKIGTKYKKIKIKYVLNEDFSKTGSMYSLSKTEGLVDDDILLFESDLLYEKKAIQCLIDSKEPNEILIATLSGSGDEVYIVVNENNELINLGKNITNKQDAMGELVGISKLSLDFLTELYKLAKVDYNNNNLNYHYEEVIFKLSKTYPIKCKLIRDLNWIEIDNLEDLNRAKNIIYPKIQSKEKNKK
jgi:2-aminoethylphosphonate-pyruvate transaminase